MRKIIVAAAVLAAWIAPVTPAQPITAEKIIAPFRNKIALCEAARDEVARQSDLYQQNLAARKAWHESIAKALQINISDLAIEQTRRRAFADLGVSSVGPLTAMGSDQALVPHMGWGTVATFDNHRAVTDKAIAAEETSVSRGEAQFSVPGLGWVSRNSLEELIAGDIEGIAALQAAVDAGDWQISFPGIGWVSRNGAEACVNAEVEKIDATETAIADGTYAINLPHLGYVTAKGLTEQIEALERQLQEVRSAKAAHALGIVRAGHGHITAEALSHQIKANEDAVAALNDAIGKESWGQVLPGLGHFTAAALRVSIAAEQDGIAEVERVAGAGDYPVPSGIGQHTRKTATEALALPDCVESGPTPCLNPDHRPLLQDVLARIPAAVQTDLRVRTLSLTRYQSYLASLANHAGSEFDRRKMVLDILGVMQGEFDIELIQHEGGLESRIEFLRLMLDELP
ncbi:MAG: hypothetical protein GY717_14625 [Rhodobacteraceae bacterium]|nr:hypothetical protein [Paracoccaceae bacterium]